MHEIDFSSKHHVLIRNDDGTLQPMDQPYFKAECVAPGTWKVLSDGDYTYLVEGAHEALVIDSGYGCGNIRAFCQQLTKKPVRRIANTHDHFDHTANNCYFDCAYMSAKTKEKATIPFPSFEGILFPRDYPVEVIEEGYVFDLGGRTLETFSIPNHADGSLAFLDRKERILFSGDEIPSKVLYISTSVEQFLENMQKLMDHRHEFDRLCAGSGVLEAELVDCFWNNAKYILSGHEGVLAEERSFPSKGPQIPGVTVYNRRLGHWEDFPKTAGFHGDPDLPYLRTMVYADCEITYDIRKIYKGECV